MTFPPNGPGARGPQAPEPPPWGYGPPSNQSPPGYGPPESPPRRRNRAALVGVIVALVLLVGGGIAVAVLLLGNESEDGTAVATSAPTTQATSAGSTPKPPAASDPSATRIGPTVSATPTAPQSDASTEEAKVEAALRNFAQTLTTDGWPKALELMCPKAREEKEMELRDRPGDPARVVLVVIAVNDVEVDGDSAHVSLRTSDGSTESDVEAELRKESGTWLVCS